MEIVQRLSKNMGGYHNPDGVIWHCMDSEIDLPTGNIPAWEWLNYNLGYSAHLLFYPDGSVVQMVPFDRIAWHAYGNNTNKIGAEFLIDGKFNGLYEFFDRIKKPWHTGAQYASAVWVMRNLFPNLPMYTHDEVDNRYFPDGVKKKQDPGAGFPWETFKSDCKIGL